ncbi:hypothetical protein CPB83DRAFT_858827 [Crepidotus variabilis]|uniref:T6SS Phospholipase effector Tle1-like catalytic domain-containing protein n=1 Tax=Crepidotus variabilis TaxID=179855 RepID=A0A9P6EAR1_9AGAR|nr:hypothetical protein CPB83DRAFT_858827 [Crepidotus variabilis]
MSPGHLPEVSTTSTFVDSSSRFARGLDPDKRPDGLPPSAPSSPVDDLQRPTATRREDTLDPGSFPAVIPPDRPGRTLVVCFDGTGDQFDNDNSNIVLLVSLLKKDDRTKQLVYYQTGIGTYTSPKVASSFTSRIEKTLDEMIAWNLHAHVMAGYEFLMQNYISGDKICLFGFSRGAYTARSLAGMLHKIGLLPAGNFQQVPFAYKMYKRSDDIGWEQSNEFKKTFCVDVPIEFVGVWDTVDSVGLIPKRLPFTTSNTIVRTFRHAVALDERRSKFKANLWNRPDSKEEKLGDKAVDNHTTATAVASLHGGSLSRVATADDPETKKELAKRNSTGKMKSPDHKPKKESSFTLDPLVDFAKNGIGSNGNGKKRMARKEDEDDKKLNTLERMYSQNHEKVTDIDEVWFAGCHCDIGGGSVSNRTRHSLARIPLRWMIRECFKTETGIMFNSDKLLEIGLDPTTLYPYVAPRPPALPLGAMKLQKPPADPLPIRADKLFKKKQKSAAIKDAAMEQQRVPFLGSEEEEELRDAVSPKYDQLSLAKGWWVLEVLPLKLRYQRADNQWVSEWGLNLAAPRYIPKQRTGGFKVHRSVKLRMEAEYQDEKRRAAGKRYIPKPIFKVDPTWVD